MSTSSVDNTIFYQLVLEAQQFIDELARSYGTGLSFNEMMEVMKVKAKETSSELGIDYQVVVDALLKVYAAGKMTNEQLAQLGARSEVNQLRAGLDEANTAGISLASTLRMVEGVIVSMAVFQGIQLIGQMFSDAVKDATDYYQALQNITVAQDALARSGVNITNQQMLDMVNQIHQQWQTISQVDITQAVAQAGLMANEFGLSVSQMQQLANEAAVLHQLDPSKSMAQYVDQLGKALKDGNSLGAVAAQLSITTEETKQKAMEMGLIGENFKGTLSDQVARAANLEIIYERLNPEAQKLTGEIKDGSNALVLGQEASAQWKDMLTALGEPLNNVLNMLKLIVVNIVEAIFDFTRMVQQSILFAEHAVESNQLLQDMLGPANALLQLMTGNVHSAQDFVKALQQGKDLLDAIVSGIATVAVGQPLPDRRNLGGTSAISGINLSNTPPSPGGGDVTGASTIDESKLTSILDSVAKDYQSYYDSVTKDTQAFDLKMQDMQDRYNLDVQKEIQNTNLRMSEEKANYRLKELQQEENFQQKMRELQDRYLLDLEDALRKRDAEAVIKVIERYNMEKDTAQQQENLKIQQDKQNEQLKLQQMKQEEDLRLKQMQQEYDLQKTEAQRAFDLQQAQLKQALDAKLQEEAVKAQQELGLNQSSIDSIYKLFTEYYGPGGKFASTQQGAYTKMIEQSQGFVDQMAAIMQEFAAVLSGFGNVTGGGVGVGATPSPSGGTGNSRTRFAGGGVALAASATDVTFGDAGPELAMFLPLNASHGSPQASVGGGFGGGMGGQATIALSLGPDLEARIVNTTLTHAAISIEKVNAGG